VGRRISLRCFGQACAQHQGGGLVQQVGQEKAAVVDDAAIAPIQDVVPAQQSLRVIGQRQGPASV